MEISLTRSLFVSILLHGAAGALVVGQWGAIASVASAPSVMQVSIEMQEPAAVPDEPAVSVAAVTNPPRPPPPERKQRREIPPHVHSHAVPSDEHSTGATAAAAVKASAEYYNNPPPRYPESARRLRQTGVVRLLVTVDASGFVSSIAVAESSGFEQLDRAALQAVRQWRFKPASLAGVSIASQVEVPIRFELHR